MSDFGGALKPLNEHPDYKMAILGVPFDEKSSYIRGTAGGPRAIRQASTGKCYNEYTELGVNLAEETVLVDLGDVDTSGDVDKSFALTEKAVAGILDKGAVPVVLGGDHSITYPIIKAFAKKFKPLDILHFDAHPDLYEDLYGDRLSHACPFARIMEDGLAQNLVQVGIRAATPDHKAKALKHGVRMIEMKEIHDPVFLKFANPLYISFDLDALDPAFAPGVSNHEPGGLSTRQAIQIIQALKHGVRMIEMKEIHDPVFLKFANPLYISFDLDALDPAFAPGVSHHEPGGLSTRQAIQIIQALKARIVGFDIVELNASRDASGITAAAAFKLFREIAGKTIRP